MFNFAGGGIKFILQNEQNSFRGKAGGGDWGLHCIWGKANSRSVLASLDKARMLPRLAPLPSLPLESLSQQVQAALSSTTEGSDSVEDCFLCSFCRKGCSSVVEQLICMQKSPKFSPIKSPGRAGKVPCLTPWRASASQNRRSVAR